MSAQTDRELLERAARAAGIDLDWDIPPNSRTPWRMTGEGEERGPASEWNPLADDGDALRLAVKLGLFFSPDFSHFLSLERFSAQDRDDCYTHRRAIVRAAAAIAT